MPSPQESSPSHRQVLSALERYRGSLADDQRALFVEFVNATVDRLRGPFLAQHPAADVLQWMETAFQFASVRQPDEISVDVRRGSKKGAITLSSMRDQSFIVDTVRLFLKHHDADFWTGINVVFDARRDEAGRLVGIGGGSLESLVLFESDEGSLIADLEAAKVHLRFALDHARATVRDFKKMTSALERAIDRVEARAERDPNQVESDTETAGFLKWLLRENMVLMGMVTPSGDPLGIMALDGVAPVTDSDWPTAHKPGTVRVRKSRSESMVHRSGRIDEILVTLPDQSTIFVRGLFTYRAITQPSRNVPILRGVLADILEAQGADPGSYRYKGIANVFDSLPTEYLFTASTKAIAELVDLVFEAEQMADVGVTLMKTGPDSAFCVVAMPKHHYGEDVRQDVEKRIVHTLKATYCDHGVFVGRYDTLLIHYFLTGATFPDDPGVQRLTDQIRETATPWLSRLWRAVASKRGEGTADRMVDAYGHAFGETWTRGQPIDQIVYDIEQLESLSATKTVGTAIGSQGGDRTLSVYQARDIYLTDILPVLDAFGIVAIDGSTCPVRPRSGAILHIDLFRLQPYRRADGSDAIETRKQALSEAIEAVFSEACDSDRLNELVLSADLSWQEVDVLRGYVRYARQLNVKVLAARAQEILLARPEICRHLVALFHARFDPDFVGDRDKGIASAVDELRSDIRKLRTHDEDLLVNSLLALIQGTIRTNYYRTDKKFHYLSFKLEGARVPMMGARRPMFEIYVHHKYVEGVHLRFAKVARGGLRWSDRDDYRTEVLGLVTTQQVKNVVIVPEGAKGGFHLKRPSRDGATRRAEADRHYETFIRGLLDVTDNGVGGRVTPPPRVVRHDGDDPYLVVAADKGTAHLSDTANKLSLEYGHWLGDAFASGGSVGYDHKKVGITARGGWVLVRRLFAEIGRDPYSEPFTAVGIGDCSGDVFGNGVIETPHMRLLAAFNHMHIFLDPNPDAAVSHAERLRLFRAERKGGWENYDKTLISKGGGVFERTEKSIPLSPECQAMLGIPSAEAEPEVVLNAILKMDVDLLWNGGIGTYVKASTETHADADDRSNDGLRVDGAELRAKIIGEGGNLGCTQRGRIEASLKGMRMNTDAIDNSGGVDMSDHEVNLKILLDRVVQRGELTYPERNEFLAQMTDEVAVLVMADNDAHGRQISRDELRSREDIFPFSRAIAFVEQKMGQARDALRLPDEVELQRRAAGGLGLTRPELAVLSAWVKMYIYRELLRGDPKALPGYRELLVTYFPVPLQQRFLADIESHMLANEIAMTVATTRLVADAGASFVPALVESTGRKVGDIVAAYLVAQKLAAVDSIRTDLDNLRIGPALIGSYRAWIRMDRGVRDVVSQWMAPKGKIPEASALTGLAAAVDTVAKSLPADAQAKDAEAVGDLTRIGLPTSVATAVVKSQHLGTAVLLEAESKRSGVGLAELAVRHAAVGRATRIQEILDDLAKRPATGRWDPVALQILHGRYLDVLRKAVSKVKEQPNGADFAQTLAKGQLSDMREAVDEVLGTDAMPSIATLIVLEERLAGASARITA